MCGGLRSDVDCEAGRRLGCQTFCCRLLVRLRPEEMEPGDGTTAAKGYVDKDEDGYCVNFDRETNRCKIWENRPQVCREYSCNTDFMLQIVLREGLVNIVQAATAAARAYIPKESYITIPYVGDDDEGGQS